MIPLQFRRFCVLAVFGLAGAGPARAAGDDLRNLCRLVLAKIPTLNFEAQRRELTAHVGEVGDFLGSLRSKNGGQLKTQIDQLLTLKEGSPAFYAQAKLAIETLNGTIGDKKLKLSFRQYIESRGQKNLDYSPDLAAFLNGLYNRLLKVVVSAQPGSDAPEMAAFFRIRSDHQVADPELRAYALLQTILEKKGSEYKDTRPEAEFADLLLGATGAALPGPRSAWDTLFSTVLLVDGTQFSDAEFGLIRASLLSREPHVSRNARDLLAFSAADNYLSEAQIRSAIEYAGQLDDVELFRDVVDHARIKSGSRLEKTLRQLANNTETELWPHAARTLVSTGDRTTTSDILNRIDANLNPELHVKLISTITSASELTPYERSNLSIAMGNVFRLPATGSVAKILEAVNLRDEGWQEVVRSSFHDHAKGQLKQEMLSDPHAAISAVEVARLLPGGKDLLTLAIRAARKARRADRIQILDKLFYLYVSKDVSAEDITAIHALFDEFAQDPEMRSRQQYELPKFLAGVRRS